MKPTTSYKVLQIIPQMSVGGRERVVYSIVRGMRSSIFEPYLLSLRGSNQFKELFQDVVTPIYSLNKKANRFDPSIIRKLKTFIVDNRIDIVHTHNPGAFIYGSIAALLARVKVVVNTEHGYSYSISRRKRWIEDFLRNRINLTIAVSESLKKQICSAKRVNPQKVVVVRNGIKAEDFQNPLVNPELRDEIRGQCIIVVGIVGRLEPIKGHEILLEAFSICLQKKRNIRLIVVGDGTMRNYLISKTRFLGLEEHVLFIGTRTDIPKILSLIDIFVLPSLSEGLSITLLEAMAAGRAIIASDVGGNKEVISDGEDGILIPPNAPEVLAQKLLILMDSPEKRDLLAKRAQEKVKKFFSEEKMVEAIKMLYLEQLGKNSMS